MFAPCRSDKEAASERSIPGLMAALERGEMPAAQQPAGLTVQVGPAYRRVAAEQGGKEAAGAERMLFCKHEVD